MLNKQPETMVGESPRRRLNRSLAEEKLTQKNHIHGKSPRMVVFTKSKGE